MTEDVDVRSPCRMIWTLAGRPTPTDPQKGEGICALCGIHAPLHAKIGPNFTDYRRLAHVDGIRLCAACSWTTGGKPPRTLRMWTVVARLDQKLPESRPTFLIRTGQAKLVFPGDDLEDPDAAEIPTPLDLAKRLGRLSLLCRSRRLGKECRNPDHKFHWNLPSDHWFIDDADYLCLAAKNDLRCVASILADPPADGSPWLVAVAESGKKHCTPFTPVNRGVGAWTVMVDGIDVTSTPAEWQQILGHVTALRAVGFSASAVETGHPAVVALTGDRLKIWQIHAPRLAAYIGTPLLHLASLVLSKETLGDYLATYITD